MKKILTIFLCAALLLAAGCGEGGGASQKDSESSDSGFSAGSSSSAPEGDPTLAENYDFGDPSSWAGEGTVSVDLGDCLMEPYPYDERYDWGQSILYDEEEGVYKMWWCRHSGYDSIWYAESGDLKNWHSLKKLMAPETNTTWIKLHVGKPTVLKLGGRYIMYFEAPATLNGYKEFDNNVFMATSDDGLKWSVYDGGTGEPYPVIRMTDSQMQASWNQSQLSGGSGYGYYGIGQPSALYRDGVYYLYCTYSLEAGDRMYLFTSTDGVHFDGGTEVFTRAGCGVKYNALTEKFMLAYEYTQGGVSRVYYMESADGVKFTYSGYTEAANNQNILSKGAGFVRGYPDFVHDGTGQVCDHTVYVAYMEGRMADSGQDWRQYSSTWDIHIAMFNPAEYANRAQVLPDGRVCTEETILPYRAAHIVYEDKLAGIPRTEELPVLDGERDALYDGAAVLKTDRAVCEERAVPNDTTAEIRVAYTDEYLYFLVEVKDKTKNESDYVYLLVDEKRFASSAAEILNVEAWRGEVKVTDGDSQSVSGAEAAVKETAEGYNVEVKLPWRYKTTHEKYDSFGFDCFVYDNRDSSEYKSAVAWNDFKVRYNIRYAGELFFLG